MPDPNERDTDNDNGDDGADKLTAPDDQETEASDGVHQGRRDTGGYVPSK